MAWIVAQLGAREDYAVARALARRGELGALVTDAWVPPWSFWRLTSRRFADRYHPDLAQDRVQAWNFQAIVFEFLLRVRRIHGWRRILARNRWFQRRALQGVRRLRSSGAPDAHGDGSAPVVFVYSYAGLELLEWAKAQGWRTVLGQIDPGIAEEALVNRLIGAKGQTGRPSDGAPAEYWRDWRRECELADVIVVNSEWSRSLLASCDVPKSKLHVVPLAFKPRWSRYPSMPAIPARFTAERPLKVLFLGQVNVRKGALELFEAIRRLAGQPVEFWLVGPDQVGVPEDVRRLPTVHRVGAVPRSQTAAWYQGSDVFLFPTHSDGFGLTQLEAQAWGIPVIASRFCGEVVEHDRNGWVLPEVTGSAIVDAIQVCLADPTRLARWSGHSQLDARFGLDALYERLLGILAD